MTIPNFVILLILVFWGEAFSIIRNPKYPLNRRFGNLTKNIFGGNPYKNYPHDSVDGGSLKKSKMVEVVFENDLGVCGGTIIGDRYILSAAHCFVPPSLCKTSDEASIQAKVVKPANIKVYIEGICHPYDGKTCAPEDLGRQISTKTIFILDEYFKNKCTSGDLAIIELGEVIGDHGASISADKNIPISGDFKLSGFGQDPANSDATGHTLQSVTLVAEPCAHSYGYDDSMCTVEIDKDACAGDSGGALMDTKNVIYGVVSSGTNCVTMYQSTINHKADGEELRKFNGGIFTAVSRHLGFICSIASAVKGCPGTVDKEVYHTIS